MKYFVSILISLICAITICQKPIITSFLLSDRMPVYFGIYNTMGTIYDADGYLWGFDIGTYYPEKSHHTLIVKLSGTWIDNNIDVIVDTNNRRIATTFPLQLRYGGVKIGYTPFGLSSIQPSFDLFLAGGDLSLSVNKLYYQANKDIIEKRRNPLIIIEPQLYVDILLTDFIKVGLGISYRNVFNVNVPWITKKDLSGFGFHGLFKIGKF